MVLKQKIILFFVIITGVIFQVLPVIKSGLIYPSGYGFWGPNGHDGIWHLSLINHIDNPFKISMPTFSGSTLTNYHPFFDIIVHYLSQIIHINSSIWLFQIFPILSSFLLLYLSYIFGKTITKSYWGGIILLVLNFSGNSFGWLVSLIKNGTFGGESLFWAMQSPSNQINPPYNLSLIILLLIFIIIIQQKPQKSLSIPHSLLILTLLILLPITKAYSALTGFGVFGLYSLFTLIKYRHKLPFLILSASTVTSFLVFRIYNPHVSSLLIFKPFWFINSMIESPDRIFLPYLANMRYTLESSGNIGPRLIALWIFTFGIFLLGNFAWRLLGIITVIKKPNFINLSLLFLISIHVLIPTFFIQKGTSWNTIQFIYYAMFLANILLTIYLTSLSGLFQKLIIFIIFFTNFIGLLGMLPNYLGKNPPTSISISEMEALKFLSQQPPGVVLTVPYDQYLKTKLSTLPLPLYAYETTSYVSAYSKHLTFVDDYMNLDNSGYDYIPRQKASTTFFTQQNPYQDRGFLLNNNISYIYITGLQSKTVDLSHKDLFIKVIFKNQETTIYQVLK